MNFEFPIADLPAVMSQILVQIIRAMASSALPLAAEVSAVVLKSANSDIR